MDIYRTGNIPADIEESGKFNGGSAVLDLPKKNKAEGNLLNQVGEQT